jgi:predicted PurR-regulated permease PerM
MLGFDLRTAKIVWTSFIVCILIFLVYLLRETILVLVYSVFFSYLIYPLVQIAEKYKPRSSPRVFAIAIVFVLVISVFLTLVILFGASLSEEFGRLTTQLPQLLSPSSLLDTFNLPSFLDPMRVRLLVIVRGQLLNASVGSLTSAEQVGRGVLTGAGKLIRFILIPVISFLLIKEAARLRSAALSIMGPVHRKLWAGIADDLDVILAKYVRALLFLSLATLVCYGITFSLFRLPYAILLAVIASLLEFIPFVGPLSAIVIIVSVSFLSGFTSLFWLLTFIFCYRMFQDYVLNPMLMSEGVEISPLLVILGIIAGEHLGGVAGIFISVPLIAALKIVLIRASHQDATSNNQENSELIR